MTNDCRFCGGACVCSPGSLCCSDCLHALHDGDAIDALKKRLARLTEQRDALLAEKAIMAEASRLTIDAMQRRCDRLQMERDALLEACEGIASFGCINRTRVPTGTTCGKCDPCTARAAIEKAKDEP